ncbi:MAG: DUF6089 family protein [Saprospiraceae bacterium]
MRSTILFFYILFMPFLAAAQTSRPWEIGGGIGVGTYSGDLQETTSRLQSFELRASLAAHLRRNFSNNFAARLGLLYTGLAGDDKNFQEPPWRQTRAISFRGPLLELSAAGEIYPFGLYKRRGGERSKTRRAIAPFVSIGIGGLFFFPKTDFSSAIDNGAVDPARVKADQLGLQKAAVSIPMGGGIRFCLSDRLTLGLEGAFRYTLTDYLDGVSVAGNPEGNDWFYTAHLAASYSFGKEPKQHNRSRRASNADDHIPSADSDGDGVADDKDDCPDTPGMRSFKGCPDTDRDGIADRNDLCPEEPGLPSLNGCPDRDEDGITDKDDNCPDLKGVEAYRGCPPVDRDKDGVADAEDLCPDMLGQLHWKGCPDSDSDGIPDNKDGCPGIAGPDILRGCPDTDEDGIADKDDECPTIPGTEAKKGCPEAQAPAPGVPYKALYFGSTLPDWHNTSATTMDEAVAILNADPNLFARIEGHTDNTGREPANDLLAEKRAKKCLDQLVAKGISPSRLNYIGFGSGRPAVPNDTRENRQLNRRVEIHFYKK